MAKPQKLTDYLLEYIRDDRHYAVAIEGPWGSGKTRYVETSLKPSLKEEGFNLVRVSMFGIANPNDLFERMLSAKARISQAESDSKATKRGKSLASVATSVLGGISAKKLGEYGVSYQASAKVITDFVCNEKDVIVLDDAERNGCEGEVEQKLLFGAINDLVENRGLKVIFVTNEVNAIADEIREKLIWKAWKFEPDFEKLITNQFGDISLCDGKADVFKLLSTAVDRSSCNSARALIKAEPLIKMALSSSATHSERYSASIYETVLEEFIEFCLLAASGRKPTCPVRDEGESFLDLSNRLEEEAQYKKYKSFTVIEAFFSPAGAVPQQDVDDCLNAYLEENYPETPGERELKQALGDLQSFSHQDDSVVQQEIKRFVQAIKHRDFSPSDLVRAAQINAALRNLGFNELLTDKEMASCAEAVIDSDPYGSFQSFHKEYEMWGSGPFGDVPLLEKLDRYCVKAYRNALVADLDIAECDYSPTSGTELASKLEKAIQMHTMVATEIDPSIIVKCFCVGDAQSQLAINRLFMKLKTRYVAPGDESTVMVSWLDSIAAELSDAVIDNKTGTLRRQWVLKNISEIKDALNKSAIVKTAALKDR